MIKKSKQPLTWHVPEWHPDLGDPQEEVRHLSSFANALLAILPHTCVELESPEPGLLYLAVRLPDGRLAEVYSTVAGDQPHARRYGMFFDPDASGETEIYAESIEDALSQLTGWSSRAPESIPQTIETPRK